MKAIKSSLAGFILFTLAASGLFLTCEIGLGNSVDTKPPTVSISYPPTTVSYIRGDFVVAGSATDETGLSQVLVTLTAKSGADAGKAFGPWSATIDAAAKTWKVTVPQPSADGRYDVKAEAVDSAGRRTSATTSFNMDNTPPVLVVQRPSTKGNLADVNQFDAFGSDIKFNGTFYDESGPSRLHVYFFDAAGLPVSATPFTYTMPPDASWSFSLTEANDPDGLWHALESALPPSGLGTFWYTVDLQDAAYQYLDPTETGAALTAGKTGNTTTHFYNYLDISNALAVGETYPKLNDLSAFDAGNLAALDGYGYQTLTASLPSLRISSQPSDFALADNGNFSFEPSSQNPTIEIESLPIASGTPRATDNTVSPLPNPLITIYRNKNGDPLDLDALEIALTPFDLDGVTLLTDQRVVWHADDLNVKSIGADLSVNLLIDKSQGQFQLDVTAGDKAPHTVTKRYGFRINQGAPSLISVSPDKSTSSSTVYTKINSSGGKFQVVVKGSDDDTDVTLALTENGAVPADAVITRTESTAGYVTNYTWTITLDVPPTEGDTRTLRFQLADGLYTSSVREVTYQVDDTPPTLVSLASPVLKGVGHVAAGKAVVTDSLVNVRGFATGDLTNAILLFTPTSADPSGASTAGWTAAEVDNALTGTDRGFSASVPIGSVAEGTYYLWARFADDTFDATLENYGPVTPVCQVIYDKNLPSLSESLFSSSSRQYRTGAFSLAGFAQDTNALHSLTVAWSLNNGAVTAQSVVPAADGSWSFAVAAPAQGVYRYTVTATDVAGNVTSLTREVQVDAIAPVVTITGSASNINITTQEYTFRGTVVEADSGVATLEISMDGGTTWDAPEGTSVWYFTHDFGSIDEGPTRQILARATDNAGNASAEASANYTIDLANPRATLATSIDAAPITTASNVNVTFSGIADDAAVTPGRAPASATLAYSKDGGAAVTVAPGAGTTQFNLNPATGAWTWTLGTALGDGMYNVTLTVVDLAGKTATASRSVKIDTAAPTLGIAAPQTGQQESSAAFAINGISSDGTGVGFPATAAVEYSFDSTDGSNGTWTAFDPAATPSEWSGYNWSKGINLTVEEGADLEGAKRLYVRSQDRLGNAAAAFVDFYYDRTAPTLGVTGTGSVGTEQVFQTGDFDLDIAASDTNALKSLTLTATRDGVSQGTLYSASWTAADNLQNFSHSYPVAASGHALEGLWVYTIAAVDQANRETETARTVLIDTVAPSVSIAAFAGGYYADTSLSVSGTASDASVHASSGVDKVEYSVNGGADWFALNGTTVWYKTDIGASALAEGTRTVYVRATDVAGNVSASSSGTFMADHANPALAETLVGNTDIRYSNADVSFSGTLTDTNASALPTLALTIDGVPMGAVAVTGGAWSYSFDADSRAEGTYTLTFTATDAAGRHSSVTRTVSLDKTDPTVSLSTNLTDWQRFTDVTVGGSAADTAGTVNTGVASVQYSLDNATWTDLSGTTNWVGTITFPQSAANQLYLRSIDRAGNVSAVSGPHTVRVDATAPLFTETVENNTAETRINLTYSGSISDNLALHGSAPLTLKRKRNGVSLADVPITPSLGAWTYTQTVAGNDGNWELTFIAQDSSGLTTTIAKTVTIDTTAPTVAIASPGSGESSTTQFTSISGTSRDTGGVGFASSANVDAEYSLVSAAGPWTALGSLDAIINWSASNVDLGAIEGPKTLWVRSTDRLGNEGLASVNFYYDVAPPTLTESAIGSTDTQYRNADLIFGGSISDSNTSAAPTLSVSVSVNGTPEGTPEAIIPSGTSWSYTFDTDSRAEGPYTLVFTATDAAGKTSSQTRNVLIDKTNPTVTALTNVHGTWFTAGSQALSGSASDTGGSGLSYVEYRVSADNGISWGAWSNLTGTATFSGTATFADGNDNRLQVRAVDRAGNASAPSIGATPRTDQTVWIDTIDPDFDITSPLLIPVDNGAGSLDITVTATDATSGPVLLEAKAGDSDFAAGTVYSEPIVAGTATVSVTDLSGLAAGNRKIYLRVTDAAGRRSVVMGQSIIIDQTAPTVTFSSHATGNTVNKTFSLSGSASDTNGMDSMTLQVYTFTAGSWQWIAAETGTMAFDTTWTHSGFQTAPITLAAANYDSDAGAAGLQLRVRAHGVDVAGNVTDVERTLTVDQDSDRPTVTLTNVNVDGSTTLKLINTVYGTVSDDDGVAGLSVSENGSSWTAVTLTGGMWSYNASAGDGQKTLYFRVADTGGTTFTTDAADEPYVRYGASTVSAPVTFRVDTVTPEVGSSILVDRQSPFTYAADAFTGTLANNAPFGGSAQRFAVGITATDANGIKSVSVTVPGVAGSPFTASGTFTNAPIVNATDIKRGGVYQIETVAATNFTTFGAATNAAGVSFTATRDGTGSDTGTVRTQLFTTGAIDVSLAADGYVSLTVTVTDNSDLQTTATRTILIDNAAPTVTHQSPVVNSTVNGDIEVKGLADDGLGSGLKSVRYQVGINADLDPASAAWQNVSSSAPYIAWQINFTGANKIDTYANATYGTAGTGADLGLWLVPVVMRVEDNAGNVTVTSTSNYVLKVDPSGDRPKVTVVYPDPMDANRVMGGIIRVFGSSEDDDGVASVWMQIDVNNDGSFDASDVASNGTDWFNSNNGQLASGTISWNRSINTAGEFNPVVGTVAATAIRNGSVYRIVTVNGTDYTALGASDNNVGTEFRATSSGAAAAGTGTVEELLRRISFRVRARDINATPVDGTWVGPYVIDVDQNVPKIGSLRPLAITQGATVQPYQADMWVSGNWTLSGSVDDESGIAAITLAGDITGSLAANPSWFTAGTAGDVGVGNYILNIPLATVAGSTGDIQFTITALDNNSPQLSSTTTVRINYDNENPTVSTLTHSGAAITGATPVVQSNNTYTFASTVNESGSGFERVAFYFERNVTPDTGDRVYNPMETRTGNANRTYLSGLTMVNGLPRLAISSASAGFARPDQYTLRANSIIGNLNVRRGGLVRIGGIDRLISAVDHATGSIQWADPVDVSVTDAYIAYALVVDNLKVESPVWSGDTLVSIANDDGDGLIEAVERSGGLYSWTASIDSRNVPDGPIEIHWVAYDKAGNYASGLVSTSVQNNRPMLAAVTLGTDLDGNGSVSAGERVPAYSALDGLGNEQAVATVASSSFIAKGRTSVDIDVVGGNGILDYVMYLDSDGGTAVTGHDLTNGGTNTYLRDSEVAGINAIDLTAAQLTAVGDTITTVVGAARTLVIRIWDSTEETTRGTDSQYAVLTMPIQIDVTDGVNPRAAISPFFWTGTGMGNNSLYGGSKDNGHVELEADLPVGTFNQASGVYDLDPKVSGRVSVRGTVYDDQRLSSIWMFIGNGNTSGFAFTNAATTSNQFDTDGDGTLETLGRTYTRLATFNTTTGLWEPVAATVESQGWSLTLDQDYLDQGGHLVHWRLDWDSSRVTGVAAADRQIRIIAVDRRPNASSETANSTGSVTTNNVPSYQVDVVPYVNRVTTRLSSLKASNPSVFDRTALGRYPVNAADSITLNGFNLTGADVAGITGESSAGGVVTVPMSAAASGNLVLAVNGVALLNNGNSNSAAYNVLPNGDNNELLTDDITLDVWSFNNRAAVPISGRVENPVMKINPSSGLIGFAFTNGPLYYSMGGTVGGTEYSYIYWQASYDFMTSIAFAYDATGRTYGSAAGGDINSGSADKFSFMTDRWGRSGRSQSGSYDGVNALRMESIGQDNGGVIDFNKYRILSPQYATTRHGTSTNIYLAYFDDLNAEIRFRYGNLNDTQNTKGNFTNFRDTDQTGYPPAYNTTYKSMVAGSNTGNNPGEYVSIGVVPGASQTTDVVVIAWYDATLHRLLYSYNTTPATDRSGVTDGTGWSTPRVIFNDAGEYCQIAVDAAGGIHMAAYDINNADLVYAYLDSYLDVTPETCTVDSYGIVGTNITLDTAMVGGVAIPYIGYYTQSSVRPKFAYLANTASRAPAGVIADKYTGAWEIALLPTASSVPQDRINVGVWKNAGTGALAPSVSGTSTYVKTGSGYTATNYGFCYGNGTSNGVLAYQIKESTNGYIETAQKR